MVGLFHKLLLMGVQETAVILFRTKSRCFRERQNLAWAIVRT